MIVTLAATFPASLVRLASWLRAGANSSGGRPYSSSTRIVEIHAPTVLSVARDNADRHGALRRPQHLDSGSLRHVSAPGHGLSAIRVVGRAGGACSPAPIEMRAPAWPLRRPAQLVSPVSATPIREQSAATVGQTVCSRRAMIGGARSVSMAASSTTASAFLLASEILGRSWPTPRPDMRPDDIQPIS
jgi:hypothetical protein